MSLEELIGKDYVPKVGNCVRRPKSTLCIIYPCRVLLALALMSFQSAQRLKGLLEAFDRQGKGKGSREDNGKTAGDDSVHKDLSKRRNRLGKGREKGWGQSWTEKPKANTGATASSMPFLLYMVFLYLNALY